MSAAVQLSRGTASDHGRIPVLDIGPYLAGEPGPRRRWRAPSPAPAKTPGFSSSPITACRSDWSTTPLPSAAQFFARPEADKLALKIGKYNIGYLPFGGQVVRHSPVNKNTKPNFSESFYITRDRAPDHPDIVNNKPLVGLNRWPPDMPEFRAATTAYYAAMEAMTTRLVPVVRDGARICRPDYFADGLRRAELHDPADPLPAAPEPGGQRVRLRAAYRQQFHHVPRAVGAARVSRCAPPRASGSGRRRCPGTFVVNTGAMLARYSNDRFRATPHRVINRNDRSRYAIPFFLGPNHDCGRRTASRPASAPTTRRATSRPPTAPSPSAC